jgi:hypothetical protein
MQFIKTSLSNSKFVLVPFFSVLEKDVKINLPLSAFVQMFTYILYCPVIAQCPWLQQMIPTNIINCNFLMHKIPSKVECLVLLHSPIIINVEKLGTIHQEVYDDKMDNDFTTQEVNNYFSSSEFVSGCIFKKEQNSFTWIHEIELNGLYKKIGGLMNFLLDTRNCGELPESSHKAPRELPESIQFMNKLFQFGILCQINC